MVNSFFICYMPENLYGQKLQYKPFLSFGLENVFFLLTFSILALIEVSISFVILKIEKMAFFESVVFLLMLSFSLCNKYKPKRDHIASSVQKSQFDGSGMKVNHFYSLNRVKPCNMAPKNFAMNLVHKTLRI